MLVFDTAWRKLDSTAYESGIVGWLEEQSPLHFMPLLPGKEINWTMLGPKKCIGRFDQEYNLQPCPTNSVVENRAKRCDSCSSIDEYTPCIRCDGERCLASEKRWIKCKEAQYAVYLALFGDKTVKVGVSKLDRVRMRWLEQGADYAGILLSVKGGMEARKAEKSLSKLPSITQKVQTKRKASMLLNQLTYSQAKSKVEEILADEAIFMNSNIELEDLSKHYTLSDLDTQPQIWPPPRKSIDFLQLGGTVLGMKGSILVIKFGSAFFAADLKRLIGYSIDDRQKIEMEIQGQLLEYL